MKILQLCHKVPFPPKDGGCLAMHNLTMGLIDEGHEVKVLSINTKKHFVDISQLPDNYKQSTQIEAVYVDTDVKIADAFFNLFKDESYNISRFYSLNFEKKLIEVLKQNSFDVVQLESLFTSVYSGVIKEHSTAKIVLRAHNIENELWFDAAKKCTNIIKKQYLHLLAKRLKNYELESLSAYDAIVAITEKDKLYFKSAGFPKETLTIPFGISLPKIEETPIVKQEPDSLFHIGAMDWQPNKDGIAWFINNVWPKVSALHPEAKFYLAGRNIREDEFKTDKTSNISIVGEVEDAKQFMLSKNIMIVPLLSGAGMRVKIIEGLALGKTIIATTIGAEGIDYENNKNIIIANSADEFIEAIHKCITDTSFAPEIGKNAKILALEKYNNSDICNRLSQFYQHLIEKNN
jgi:glycosyltransferase involved in cell wall biosynthesis